MLAALRDRTVRNRLLRDSLWILSIVCGLQAVAELFVLGLGFDSRSYWMAWRGPMYFAGPGDDAGYLYSPAFAQLIWPIAHLPWEAFRLIFPIISGAALAWLLKPLPLRLALPLWIAGLPELVAGNVYVLLATCAAVGLRRPSLWAFPLLTKITPGVGLLWFAARGEWRKVSSALGATVGVIAASYAISPEHWTAWLSFLSAHSAQGTGPLGSHFVPGVAVRLPVAIGLVIWGARGSRIWTLPTAMCLAAPVFWLGTLTLFAALPRLSQSSRSDTLAGETNPRGVRALASNTSGRTAEP